MNIEYRHPTETDVEAMTIVLNSSSKDMKHTREETVEEIRKWTFGEKDYDPEGYLLAFLDGQPVGYGGSTIMKMRLDAGFKDAYLAIAVVPEHRGKGIEQHLTDFSIEYLKSKSMKQMKRWAAGTSGWRHDLALEYGMKDIRHGYVMLYDKNERPPEVELPEGFTLKNLDFLKARDSDIEEFVNAFNDSFLDHWNFAPAPAERFIKARDHDEDEGRKLWLTYAYSGDEIAGVCFYGISPKYNREHDINAGWSNILGVRKNFRRNGLGRTLLAHGMCRMWDEGMDRLYLGMDAENRRALDLYTSLGYRVDEESITYELSLY